MEQMESLQPEPSAPVRMDLKPERVQEALKSLPAWKLRRDGLAIESVRKCANSQRASSFAAHACRLASKLGQPAKVRIKGKKVVVTLTGHPVRGCTGGLTDAVFKLADLIGS